MQAELTQDAAKDQAIMDKIDCWCVTNRKEQTESRAAAQKQIVTPNPQETVEIMKERIQQRAVEQIVDVLVTTHVEAAQAQ